MGDTVAHMSVVAKSHSRINEIWFAISTNSIRNSNTSSLLTGDPVGEFVGTEHQSRIAHFHVANTLENVAARFLMLTALL
jgi:hypothetical protein